MNEKIKGLITVRLRVSFKKSQNESARQVKFMIYLTWLTIFLQKFQLNMRISNTIISKFMVVLLLRP